MFTNDVRSRLLTLLPILTVELTFACVPAAERDQSDDADEQDTASAHRSSNNYQHRQGFCNKSNNGRKVWGGEGRGDQERRDEMRDKCKSHKCAHQGKRKTVVCLANPRNGAFMNSSAVSPGPRTACICSMRAIQQPAARLLSLISLKEG